MAPTTTTHQFLSAVTNGSGATTIKFEGVKPQRTNRAYPFIVGYVSTFPWKYDAKLDKNVPSDECKFVIVKGTSKIDVARKAQREYHGARHHAEPAVILRMVQGGYEVMS